MTKPRLEFLEIYGHPKKLREIDEIRLKIQTYENARKFTGGYDIYFLGNEWRGLIDRKGEQPVSPDGAFVSFVKWYVEKHGSAR